MNSYTVNAEAVACLPEKVARKHMAFPLLKVGSTLVVAIASPKNLHALDDLRFASGCAVQMMVAMETEIQSALDKYYSNQFGPSGAQEQEDSASVVVIDVRGPSSTCTTRWPSGPRRRSSTGSSRVPPVTGPATSTSSR